MSEINNCPKCGGGMSEALDLLPLANGIQMIGDLYLHCTNGDCDVESERYSDSDEGIKKWNELTAKCGCGGLCDSKEPCPMAYNAARSK